MPSSSSSSSSSSSKLDNKNELKKKKSQKNKNHAVVVTNKVIEDESSPSSYSSNSKDHYYSIVIFGKKYDYTAFSVWRIAFYILMAYNWQHIYHGPLGGPWIDSMTYDHAEWVYELTAPDTPEKTERLRWFGFVMALLSTFNDKTTIILAVLTGTHIFTALTMFINHHYLFFLLSTLMAMYCNCSSSFNKVGWIHALRGQIIVVYAYASLWKFDIDWIDGSIVKGIFFSFEEQGHNRGIPWNAMYETYGQQLFIFIAIGGVVLDTMLFIVCMFLKPGHKLQSICIVFHGFTGYTMSQRIGYSFPLAMILASLLFQPQPIIMSDDDDGDGDGDSLSHAEWLVSQIIGGGSYQNDYQGNNNNNNNNNNNHNDDNKEVNNNSSSTIEPKQKQGRHILPLLWLLLQWLIPLRMPLVSNMEYKHTYEGYRWSWTMMLHGKVNMHSPGIFFMTLRPECHGNPYPNPSADQNAFSDVNSFPYEEHLVDQIRSSTVMQMFPRQMPKVFHEVDKVMGKQCTNGQMVMKTAYFSSTNAGPFHRIIDPTVDLLETYRSHRSSNWRSKFWYALIDKARPGYEFVLRGTGSIDSTSLIRVGGGKTTPDQLTFVDRSSCLQVDPIRIHNNNFVIQFDTDDDSDFGNNNNNNNDPPPRLLIRGCPEVNLQNCHEIYLDKGEKKHVSMLRTVTIGIDRRRKFDTTCSESTKEDIVIKLTQIQKPEMMQQQMEQMQQQQQR